MSLVSTNLAGEIEIQLDTALFPSHSLVDISSTLISADVDLGIEQDCGSCSVVLTSRPSAAVERVRLYVYGYGDLLFNGEIAGVGWAENGIATLTGQDAMARLRNKWTLEDRTYTSATEQSVVQNLVEASGIDASLTSITGESWLIGVAQDVILHGGVIDLLTGDPGQSDVPLDLIRLIDRSTPLYATYSDGAGVVNRKLRAIGSSVASFSTSNSWGYTRQRSANGVVNACKVIGLNIAGVPLESLYQDTSSWVFDPPKYITEEINSYLIEDQIQADLVSAAVVAAKNGRLNVVTFTTPLNSGISPCDTITITSTHIEVSSQTALITNLKHHIDGKTGTTTVTCEWYS